MDRLAELREQRALTLRELSKTSGVSPDTINQIELGHRKARPSTLRKLARALDVDISDFFEPEEMDAHPKARGPLPRNPVSGEAERRLNQVPETLGSYIFGRVERHEAELESIDSPHFRTATSAALWLAGVEEEAAAWTEWALAEAAKIMPAPRTGSAVLDLADAFFDAMEVMGFLIAFDGLKRMAEARLDAMHDAPDELASLRLQKADAAVDKARERLEELRASGE